jgi:RNA polymerase-binding transcription factor DksA
VSGALDRIEDGTFGKCQACGKEIPQERLDAVPYTQFCVSCERKVEQTSPMRKGGGPFAPVGDHR